MVKKNTKKHTSGSSNQGAPKVPGSESFLDKVLEL